MSNNKLNPYYITGFTDAEGCFNVTVSPRGNGKYQVSLRYYIELHHRDFELLKNIQSFFGNIGSINIRQKKDNVNPKATLSIRKFDDIIKYIIPHFDKYPLLTQKQADFLLFKKIALLMSENRHLSSEGLSEIVSIKASMNLGLSQKLFSIFPVEPHKRPEIKTINIPDPYWITGFIDGEGSFFVNVFKVNDTKTKYRVKLMFRIAQDDRDLDLLNLIIKYLDCGIIQRKAYTGSHAHIIDLSVTKLSDINNKIIPFLLNYPLKGIKYKDFVDFCKVADLMNKSEHLTSEGITKILSIKDNMNRNRNISKDS